MLSKKKREHLVCALHFNTITTYILARSLVVQAHRGGQLTSLYIRGYESWWCKNGTRAPIVSFFPKKTPKATVCI